MARKRRQVVLLSSESDANASLGRIEAVRAKLADFNTSLDGGPAKMTGTEFLYGPGFLVELPTGQDDVKQAIITVQDDEIGLPVLFRMCRALGWKMLDMESGRVFG